MSNLAHCIYASEATQDLSPDELTGMLESSRCKNHRIGITGVLLYLDGSFFQVIEGDPVTVESLYSTIAADPRHLALTKIISEPITHRHFSEWSMGLARISHGELIQLVDADSGARESFSLSGIDQGRARKLLRAFCQGRWRRRVTNHASGAPAAA